MRAFALVSLVLAGLAARAFADDPPRAPAPATSPAAAGDPRPAHLIGPIALDGSGDLPPQFVDKLRDEEQDALEGSDARTVARDAAAAILRTIPELATCATRECIARLALATAAGRVVVTHLDVSGELFDITVELVDDQGRPLRRRTTRCVACTLNDAIARTAGAVRSLAGDEHDDEVTVTIRSQPPDAGVTIDGTWVGATPWAGALVAGPHHVIVSGARTVVRDLFVEAGQAVQLAIEVDRPRRFGWITYAAAGTGVAAVITGVALLSIDGEGTCDQASCPRLYETTGAGVTFTAVGLAAIGAAGWMFWHDHRHGPAAAIAPTDGGVAAVVGGRF
ncbi:MAG TPA: PEGA domain-containing protein [Kofleriaceae bacterium]|nr:PEGA domain-containing protein [Kofleriaceae bacterium]